MQQKVIDLIPKALRERLIQEVEEILLKKAEKHLDKYNRGSLPISARIYLADAVLKVQEQANVLFKGLEEQRRTLKAQIERLEAYEKNNHGN